MKNWLKSIIYFISIIFLILIIDLFFIFKFNRPLFAIKKEEYIYSGIFYDVYNCMEYSIPQIKLKGTKFNCAVGKLEIIE